MRTTIHCAALIVTAILLGAAGRADHAAGVRAGGAFPLMRRASIQLEQVRHFLRLCEESTFTRAARRCGIAQPSLSKSIRALERELGGVLFHRRPAAALTARGRIVRPYLEQIAFASDMARRVANGFIGCRSCPEPEATSAEPHGRG